LRVGTTTEIVGEAVIVLMIFEGETAS